MQHVTSVNVPNGCSSTSTQIYHPGLLPLHSVTERYEVAVRTLAIKQGEQVSWIGSRCFCTGAGWCAQPDRRRCAGNVASYAALLLWKGGLHSVSRRSRPRRTELWHACGGAAASWTLLACVLTTKAVRTWSAASRSAGTSSKAAAGTPWLWWWQLLLPPSVIKPVAGDGWLPVLSWSAALSWKDLAAMLVALADLALTIVSMSRVALLLRTVGIFTGVAAGVLIAAHA